MSPLRGRFPRWRKERPGAPPADQDDAAVGELAAAAAELSSALGRRPIDEARAAAVERLTELRAAGAISAEAFARERQRLLDYG